MGSLLLDAAFDLLSVPDDDATAGRNLSTSEHGRQEPMVLDTWTAHEQEDFEAARELLNGLVSAYSSRIEAAQFAEQRFLIERQAHHVRERRRLSVTNRDEVARIMQDYPAPLRSVLGDVA